MNRLTTNISKWILIVFIMALIISALTFVWFQYLFTINGTATYFMHNFSVSNQSFNKLQGEIGKALNKRNFHLDFKSDKYQQWTDGVTYIALDAGYNSEEESKRHRDLTIYTSDKKSKDWQVIAEQLEGFLPMDVKTIYMQVQLDPEIFGITKDNHYNGFDGVISITPPITVDKLNKVEKSCREQLLKQLVKKNKYLSCQETLLSNQP